MERKKLIKRLRKFHKWPALVLSLFTLVFAVSGIVMNHRELFSGMDVPRKYLLREYRYNNWNNAAVRASCKLNNDSILVYGNIGVWLTDSAYKSFRDFNAGFPNGIDHRKINKIQLSARGNLYAGTLFGMHWFNNSSRKWEKVDVPDTGDNQVTDIAEENGKLFVLTRSFLFSGNDHPGNFAFERHTLPPPVGYDNKEGLFKTLWVIHSGEIGGVVGKLFVDLIALVFIFLTLSGLIYWIFPGWIKKRKQKGKPAGIIAGLNRFSLKWHNKAGVWILVFLIITTVTGMFLRPPLLITIANATVKKLPFTLLDTPNPWYDKLRRIFYDEARGIFIIGTNQGIYGVDRELKNPLILLQPQPPISVMGINVFENSGEDNYLVGSFNGLYLWNPFRGVLFDITNPRADLSTRNAGSPLSDNMAVGLIDWNDNPIMFDYNRGAVSLNGTIHFPPMPEEIINESPMSLWNLALEFHTARYYQFIFGNLYILFIPLYGLTMILILITGFYIWWKVWKMKNRKSESKLL